MFAQVASNVVEQTKESVNRVYELLVPSLPTLLGALAILVVGWIGALLLAMVVRAAMRRTGFDRKLAQWCSGEGAEAPKVERRVAKGVYYLTLVFVFVAFFDMLGLTRVTESLNSLLSEILVYVPRVVGAAILLLVAWVVATVLRFFVRRVSTAAKVDEELSSQAALEGEKPIGVSNTVAGATYWLVFLLFLPAILNSLALPGLLEPVQVMVTRVLAFLPNLFAAGLLLLVGWFVARIIQRIVTNLLAAVGTDVLAEKAGLLTVLGKKTLSEVLGLVTYILILLPVIVASLNALQLQAVTAPASEMLNMVLTAVPAIFAAALVIFIAYVVGRVIASLCTNLLTEVGFNKLPAALGFSKYEKPPEGKKTPSQIAGFLLLVATMLFAIMQALPILGFTMVAALISQFLVFVGHVFVGLIIFTIGLYLANLAAQTVRASQIAQANALALTARISVIVLSAAMALRQMGLANEIIVSGFTILMGAIGVALALAFGLGCREIAGKSLEQFIESRKTPAATGSNPRNPKTPAPPAKGKGTIPPLPDLGSDVTRMGDGTPVA